MSGCLSKKKVLFCICSWRDSLGSRHVNEWHETRRRLKKQDNPHTPESELWSLFPDKLEVCSTNIKALKQAADTERKDKHGGDEVARNLG